MPRNAWFKTPSVSQFLLAFLIAPLFLLQAFAQSQPPIFPTTSFYPLPAGELSLGMATGDFNGDGQPDLVYLSIQTRGTSTAGTVTVLLNQGPTTPPIPVVTNSLNCEPQGSLVAADINNDKKLDLVVSCQSGYVVVLLGNGDGTFQAPVFYAIPSPAALITVDLNGDGYLDVVGLTSPLLPAAPTLFVLLNKGQSSPGNLSNPTNYSPPSSAFFTIGTGDFNGDGKQDILIGSSSSAGTVGTSQLSVYYGNGDGTLQTAQALPGVPGYNEGSNFFTADYNHDGFTDIAYVVTDPTNVQPPSLRVLLGSSTGQFTVGSSLILDRSLNNALLVFAGATNGGTDINIAAMTSITTILLGDGKGGFSVGQSYAFAAGRVASEVLGNGNATIASMGGDSVFLLAGNGDGTFQGIPTLPIGQYVAVADLNGDGLTDVLSLDLQGNLVTALGRGNGTFSVTNRIASVAVPALADLVTGDFNADGKIDAAVVLPGNGSPNSQLYLYQGNGDGTFQAGSSPIDLQVIAATQAVVGDFNGDGKLDLVISCAGLYPRQPAGNALVFLPGNGDGTFGAPVPFAPQSSLNSTILPLFSADLNNDGKLDLIWNSAVFLGNGDGTFQQRPLGLTGSPVALSDLNGDGIPDLVIGSGIYAGNGDGTFQSSPFFTAPTQFGNSIASAAIGDVNADGHIDLLLRYAPSNSFGDANVYVFYGDGKGNYTADSNTYYTGSPSSGGLFGGTPSSAVLARLNNQAPARPNDKTLDYLSLYGTATSLLNQLNPAPLAPPPTAKTVLMSSLANPIPTQQLTLTATVTGVSPTGTVTFLSGSTTLGSASLVNGVATLAVSFPSASTYTVTATYAGDSNNAPGTSNAISIAVAPIASTTKLSTIPSFFANENQQLSLIATITGSNPTGTVTFTTATATLGTANLASGTATLPFAFTGPGTYAITARYSGDIANLTSTSNTVTVTVTAPDYTVTATPASATVTAGQSATTQINIFPVGGYTGTVKLSCGTLPTGVTCIFAAPQLGVLLPPYGAFTTLTVATTATTTAHLQPFSIPLAGTAWAALIFLAFSPRRIRCQNRRLTRTGLLALLLITGLVSLSGCSSSPQKTTIPGTPVGVQTITVNAADSAGGSSHSISLQLTVQ